MQVESAASNTLATLQNHKNSNDVSSTSTNQRTTKQSEASSVRALAQSIDPTNMSRNEARQLADALMKAGEADLSITFFAQSAVLIPLGNGQYRQPTESDAVMNERFNMFEAIRGNIAFKQSKGLPTEKEMAALTFLEQFKVMGEIQEVDAYA